MKTANLFMFGHLEKEYMLYTGRVHLFIFYYIIQIQAFKNQINNTLKNDQHLSSKKQNSLGFIESHPPYLRFLI